VAAPAGITDPTPGNNAATDTDTLTALTGFYAVVPCRLFDSRNASLGGPNPLASGSETAVAFRGHCGVSAKARVVSINVAVTQPSVAGYLTLYPEGSARPLVSAINFGASRTRANNAVVALSDAGEMTVFCGLGSGSAHVIVDVNGFFE
jgi:hypothetical protein